MISEAFSRTNLTLEDCRVRFRHNVSIPCAEGKRGCRVNVVWEVSVELAAEFRNALPV